MKKRMFAVMMAAIMMIGSAAAQPQRPQGEKREKPTAEQMAKFRTERMAKELELSQEQQQQIYDMTLTRINESQKKAQDARETLKAERKSNAEKMQKILTPEQYKKWGEMQKKQAEAGRAQGQRGEWKGRGPQGQHMAPGHKAPAPNQPHKGKKGHGNDKCGKDGQCDKPAEKK